MEAIAKKYTIRIVLLAYGALALIIAANYVIDPMEAIGSGFIKPVQEFINLRIYKKRVIDRRHDDFNGYILGSSRMLSTPPSLIEGYLPGSRFYNLSLSSGTTHDSLLFAQYIIRHHFPLKFLYVELDITDAVDSHQTESDPLMPARLNPPDLMQGDFAYRLHYLKTFYTRFYWNQALYKWQKRDQWSPEIYFGQSGLAHWIKQDRLIKEEYAQYMTDNFPPYTKPWHRKDNSAHRPQDMADLKTLVTLCRENHVTCIFFTAPPYLYELNEWSAESVIGYLGELSQITDYWSFFDYNSIAMDKNNYYDLAHYRAPIVGLIAARIFNDPSISVPADFGVYVTKDSFPAYEESLKRQFAEHDGGKGIQN